MWACLAHGRQRLACVAARAAAFLPQALADPEGQACAGLRTFPGPEGRRKKQVLGEGGGLSLIYLRNRLSALR